MMEQILWLEDNSISRQKQLSVEQFSLNFS